MTHKSPFVLVPRELIDMWRSKSDDIDDDCRVLRENYTNEEFVHTGGMLLGIQTVAQEIRNSIDGHIAAAPSAAMEPDSRLADAAMLIKRLAAKLDDSVTRQQALDWLKRNDLDGSPLLAHPDKPGQQALSDVAKLRADMKAYADYAYCKGMEIAKTTPCLGWEQKAKEGIYGKAEHQAHRDSDNWDGKHRGAWECIRMLDAFLEDTSPAAVGELVGRLRELATEWIACAGTGRGDEDCTLRDCAKEIEAIVAEYSPKSP